ncbi:MAG: hypothetical protein M3P18_04125 [Actinomycetota bacterium]|nr:hypothetical protein [Actinomycetota bacterium]
MTTAKQLELALVWEAATPKPATRAPALYSIPIQAPVAMRERLFRRDILPGLRALPVKSVMEVTGLSRRYCLLIRGGGRVPHPKHWDKLRNLAGADA